jgi:tetratricopeptide (TPR) repeat protein
MSEHGLPGDSGLEGGPDTLRALAADGKRFTSAAETREIVDTLQAPVPGAPGASADAVDAVDAFDAVDPIRGQHLTRDVLWRFMDGSLAPEEMRRTFRHLLRGCASCRQHAREVWNLTLPGGAAAAVQASPARTPAQESRHPAALELVPLLASNAAPAAAAAGPEGRKEQETHGSPERQDGNRANESAYEAVLDRVFSRVTLEEAGLEAARRRAGGLFEELMHHPPARQKMLVQNSSRFRDRLLCERLLAASHEEGHRDPARSQHLARIAVVVIERLVEVTELTEITQLTGLTEPTLPMALTGPGELRQPRRAALGTATADLLGGLRARTWAQLGNALRICSDHEGAAAAFRSAEALLAAHPRIGLLDKARVLDLRASLHRDRRQYAEAARLLDRVIAIYRRLGQSNLMGQALAQKGNVLLHACDPQGCMALLRRALELIDPQEDPRWNLIVRHNLIVALIDDGKPREAFALLFHTRPLYLKTGDRMHLLRLRWLEGQVAQGLHRLEQAEAAYREVRDAFVELGIEYDAALVSLDLAAVYAQQGRTAETRQLAQEMLSFFESRQIHREAMAAFLIFCNAAQMEQAGLGLVREVATFLKQARNTPDLPFRPPG